MLQISLMERVKKEISLDSWIKEIGPCYRSISELFGGLIRRLTALLHYGIASDEVDALLALRRSPSSDERYISRLVSEALKISVKPSSWSSVPLAVIAPAAITFLKSCLKEIIPEMLLNFKGAMESATCKYQIEAALESRGYVMFQSPTCEDPR